METEFVEKEVIREYNKNQNKQKVCRLGVILR